MATLTLNENIDRIENAKASIKTAIEAKGVVVPAEIKLDGYAAKIDEIQAGGGGGGSFDWEGTGYTPEQGQVLDTEETRKKETDIAYTRQKYAEWDPSRTSAGDFYKGDNKLVYAPLIDTSAVTDMSRMFSGCPSLTTIPLLDTSAVTNMSGIFSDCSTLTSIPQFDTSKVTSMISMFYNCPSLTSIPQFDTSKVTGMIGMFHSCYSLTTVPLLDTSAVTDMAHMFNYCTALTSVEFKGGVAPGCNCTDMFFRITTTGTFYYHIPGDYSPVLAQLPSKWTAVPVGEVPFKIRVLKDAKWLEGDQNLVMGGKTLTYEGKGIYTVSLTFTKEDPAPSTDLLLEGVKIGTAKLTQDEQIFEAGDNSSIFTEKVGADILTIVPEGGNADGWAYDEQVQGIKSAKITSSQSTTLKLSIPGPFTMTWGQDSEQNYDYAKLLNGAGTEIVSFKGKKTGPDGQEVFEGSTDDGIVQAVYSKDSGGDTGLDAFWIKSIVYKTYPPYPAA